MTGSRCFDNRRLPLFSPCASRMMIGADMRRVAKINLRARVLRHFLDLRIFILKPLLHQSLIPFDGAMQRFLRRDAELRQQATNRYRAELNVESVLDEGSHHLARP